MQDEMRIDPFRLEGLLESGVISSDRMRVIDRNVQAYGLSPLQLMENAGAALANMVRQYHPENVLFLCGSGNNGGDGMVAARILQRECSVTVLSYAGHTMTEQTCSERGLLRRSRVHLVPFGNWDDLEQTSHLFTDADLIVDALLGTGAGGAVREPILSCINLANASGKPILAVDIPSPGIQATATCAFHRRKTDDAEVADIGIPILADICTGPGDLLLMKQRERTAHKGAGGSVLIIGGGPYQGAPYLAGLAALRAGADIVRVASPIFLPFPDLIHIPLPGEHIGMEHRDILEHFCRVSDVIVCGMGLGEGSHELIRAITPFCRRLLLDADALRLPLPDSVPENTVYTPHAGEFARISGLEAGPDPVTRAEQIRKAGLCGVVLLKGAIDIISDGKRTRFNQTGSPAMTTGGTGDILAGVCGGLMTNLPPFEAACIGAYVTGLAGEQVAEKKSYGMTASDILEIIPQILFDGLQTDDDER